MKTFYADTFAATVNQLLTQQSTMLLYENVSMYNKKAD